MEEQLDFVRKANIALANVAPHGILPPERAREFVKVIIADATLLPMTTVRMMTTREFQQPTIGISNQVLFPDEEYVETPEADRVSIDFDLRTLRLEDFKAVARISYKTLKEVLEGDNFVDYVIPLIGAKARTEIEGVIVMGDKSLPASTPQNRVLRKMDGLLKKAESRVYDAGGGPLTPEVLDEMDMMMPPQFAKSPRMAVLTARRAAIRYRSLRAARQTPGGDSQLAKAAIDDHHGTPIYDVSGIPDNLGANANETVALRTDPKNILVGFGDQMQIGIQRWENAGYVEVVIRYSFDATFENPDAVVKARRVRARA